MKDFYKYYIGFILGILFLGLIDEMHNKPYFITPHIVTIQSDCPEPILPLTKENVLKEIIKQDIKEPLIVLRQVLWETGHLKCTNCSLDYNNLFGMGWNGKKYHEYTNWIESIQAYKIWQDKYYKGGNYYDFLDSIGYAEDSKYISNLKMIKI